MKNLTSMKLEKKKKKESDIKTPCATSSSSEPEFPYGLKITLEKEQIDKLGGLDVDVGNPVGIQAAGKVTSVRKENYKDYNGKVQKRQTVEIQIVAIDVTTEGDFEKAFEQADKEE
jgi:hypothetical protein